MGPLEGIKVVELGQWMVLPAACAVMSDWGADVVKIEDPRGGDPLRGYRELQGNSPQLEINCPFELDNRNKRSVAINLKRQAGREIAYRLAEWGDVFLTNFRSNALNRLGLDYETLTRVNPDLIYGHVTGYGDVGPDKDQPGFDRSAYFARSGMQHVLREPESDPPCMRPAFGDHAASMSVVAAVSAALFARERSGIAQRVSLSLYHCAIWQLGTDIQISLNSGQDIPLSRRSAATNPLTNHYRTKDQRWLIVAMPQSDPYWPGFCKAIGREALEKSPRYRNHHARSQNHASLISLLDEVFAGKPYAEWKEILDKHGIIYGLLQTIGEVTSDAQAWMNQCFTTIEHPVAGEMKTITAPGTFHKTPTSPRTAAPELGQHTEEFLLEIGYSWEDIVRFKEEGTII